MTHHTSSWADLTGDQLGMLQEAEQTLGADILLAYRSGEPVDIDFEKLGENRLRLAGLNESQVECLQGLESKLEAVVIAYQHRPK
jgi:hypothetical protein